MTEAEAKQRWCPFAMSRSVSAQTEQGVVQVANMLGPPKDKLTVLCLASDCMAWRGDNDLNEIMGRVPPLNDPRAIADGYCGLAGKP